MDLARVVTRQCECIVKIYSVLIFSVVALLHRSLARSLCEMTLRQNTYARARNNADRSNLKIE